METLIKRYFFIFIFGCSFIRGLQTPSCCNNHELLSSARSNLKMEAGIVDISPFSDTEQQPSSSLLLSMRHQGSTGKRLQWGWGQLPDDSIRDSSDGDEASIVTNAQQQQQNEYEVDDDDNDDVPFR